MPTTASWLQTFASLAIVVALIAALAWVLRRTQRLRPAMGNPLALRGQIMVGPRERVVLLELGDQWIVAGVAAGSVRPLAVMPRQALPPGPDTASPDTFATLLSRLRKGA